MKVSEITIENLKEYIKIDTNEEDVFLQSILLGSKAYIKGYTGLDDVKVDEKEDLSLVVYVLCSELYDNRQYTVDKDKVNPVIKSILDMYSINLL
ncbi:phage gp6-like head-tail connector protein [Clostridium magnum DSM 2767]|uniref:Phage gp6-like head-tail connector protein n=1 Tax=Clostridium magnum DSM 2767 TaxID=1121326 RepID=A0A168E1F6_9CLOT|nr:head-tail connector protein [Clostridium magnum]KZL93551.1 phage gp6-like head-tail connector protein [Clostridium magnum DSM 2767]SHI60925.1 uncharacterized phage protein (possible DNA packaging) [Clostridium magnum DSM 2767]